MRLAHITDIHWQTVPQLSELPGKRTLGTLNLYLRGRRHHFDETVQDALIEHLIDLEPDAVFITGDLTAQALGTEFEKARQALQPVLDRFPTLVIPGNHDVYTRGSYLSQRMRAYFRPWMHLDESGMACLELPEVVLVGLDPNRPHPYRAAGVIPESQLRALEDFLNSDAPQGRPVILGLHHPPADRRGQLYTRYMHGLSNAASLVEVIERAALRPAAILCGHVHHGYSTALPLSSAPAVPVFDCGSSGYAFLPEHRRCASMCVYEVGPDTVRAERYQYDGSAFREEPGGAFATGR